MRKWKWWALAGLAATLAALLAVSPTGAQGTADTRARAGAQLVVDGQVVGHFSEVSGLDIEFEVVEAVCPRDSRDCDDKSTLAWEAGVRRALWELAAAADGLDDALWLSTRTRHETAMNAIRNIRAIAADTEDALNQGGAPLKTRHDTVKNSIGNIRAVARVLSDITVNEEGVNLAPLGDIDQALATLQQLSDGTQVRKRPGRVKYGDITLRRSPGTDVYVWKWFQEALNGTGARKSAAIVILDATGAEVARYNLFECWPVSYAADVNSEKIELAVEKVERAR